MNNKQLHTLFLGGTILIALIVLMAPTLCMNIFGFWSHNIMLWMLAPWILVIFFLILLISKLKEDPSKNSRKRR